MTLTLTPLLNIPLVASGDDLAELVLGGLRDADIEPMDGDILVITQKVVSKSEGRTVQLSTVNPSRKATKLAAATGKGARLIELMLQETVRILRCGEGVIITQHASGLVCPSAGIDLANVSHQNVDKDAIALLLPTSPDRSASDICHQIMLQTGKHIGVLIIDSFGRPWRKGSVGCCIGLSGVPAVVDFRGQKDLFGRIRHGAKVAVADELAAAASLVMGQNADRLPVVHVRGFPYKLRESSMTELIRSQQKELF